MLNKGDGFNMNKLKAILIVGAALMASLAFARPEPNAFLNKAATTHKALMDQVRNDPEVMNRFMRHFGMTREQVIAYFQGLRPSSLSQDGVYLVYNCQEDTGEIQARVIFYKKGTRVWVDSTGTPVLKQSCANPMVRGTDDLTTTVKPDVNKPVEKTRPLEAETKPSPTPIRSSVFEDELEVSPAMLTAESITPPVPAVVDRSRGGLGWLPLLGLAFLTTGGGSDGGDTGTPGCEDPGGCEPPVPEPGTMIVLGAGIALVAARRRRKQS